MCIRVQNTNKMMLFVGEAIEAMLASGGARLGHAPRLAWVQDCTWASVGIRVNRTNTLSASQRMKHRPPPLGADAPSNERKWHGTHTGPAARSSFVRRQRSKRLVWAEVKQ